MRIIAGKYRGKKLVSPLTDKIRPTSDRAREAVFNILNSRLEHNWEAFSLLEVFAGTGALGLEALSRGIKKICQIDIDTKTAAANAALFPAEKERITLLRLDAAKLGKAPEKYNLLFMDAPYNQGLTEKALKTVAAGGWLEEGALCLAELEKNEQITIPEEYELQEERIYGLAKILFLRYRG